MLSHRIFNGVWCCAFFFFFWNDEGNNNLLIQLNNYKPDQPDLQNCSDISWGGHSIPLTSRRETPWFAASLRTEGWAAQQPAEERSPSRLCVNFWESDSTPWLRYHTSRKKKQIIPQRRLHRFTIYAREHYFFAIARFGSVLLLV